MACVGCKHLDYDEHFTDCEIVSLEDQGFPDVRYWKRGPSWIGGKLNEGNPEKVQFCKLRGRIKGIFQCYNAGELSCYEAPDSNGEGL